MVLDDVLANSLGILGESKRRDRLLEAEIGGTETDYQVGVRVATQAVLEYVSQLGVSERYVRLVGLPVAVTLTVLMEGTPSVVEPAKLFELAQ